MKMLRCIAMGLVLSMPLSLATATPATRHQSRIPDFSKPHVPGELIIGLKPLAVDAVSAVALDFGVTVTRQFRSRTNMVIRTDHDSDLEVLAGRLAKDPRVRFVEPNYIIKADRIPNDPRFEELYGLNNSGQLNGVADADIDAPEAWDHTIGNRKILVGVIDTGIDYTHPDLAANYWNNPGEMGTDAQGNDKRTNGIDDDGNGYVDDFRGWDFAGNDNDPIDDNGYSHGTHCAGTIGAVGDNGIGITGINWQVGLVGIKFLDAGGSGTSEGAIQSIEYATLIGVNVTNNSWGGGGYSQAMADAIAAANDANILFIAAAGNDGADNDASPHYPSNYEFENIISVAATDRKDALASFSNYGKKSVDVAAPGVDILSTQKNNTYGTLSGTSMATPHVTGAVALIMARFPELSPGEIKSRIMLSGDLNAATQGKTQTGRRLNVLYSTEDDRIAPSAPAQLAVVEPGRRQLTVAWQAAGDDGDVGLASVYEVRWSPSPVESEAEWAVASTPALSIVRVSSAGIVEGIVSGLPFNTSGYVALRGVDNVGNRGPISESVPFATQAVQMIFAHDAESMAGVVGEGTWGIEKLADRGGMVFSDSPGGKYKSKANHAMTLETFDVSGENMTLTFMSKTDLERGYDFGLVEVRSDVAQQWKEVLRLTDRWSWREHAVSLADVASGADWVQVRFRLTSDADIEYDGWFIDDVAVIADVR